MDIDEYTAVFRAVTAPFVEGMTSMSVAAERMAAVAAQSANIVFAATERMALGSRTAAASADMMALQGSIAYQRMAQQSMAASAAMTAAAARATAATAAVGTTMVAAEAQVAAGAAAMTKRFAMGALGAGLIAGATVKMAGDFEIATTRLVSSAGETHEGMMIIREGILKMAGEVGNTSAELAKAMYVIASGGQHGADGLLVLRAAAEGAAAEGAELYEVADAITSILADYHLKASEAARVTSVMVAAVGSGKTTFQEFSSSLSAILPIASAAHISLEDISAAIASMTVHGMSARQASQNLADVVRHMVAPTQVQTKELGQLGMSSADLAEKLGKKGLTGTLQEISLLIISKMGPSGKVLLDALNQSKEAANSANVMIGAMPKNLQALTDSYKKGELTLAEWRKTLKALPADQANLLAQWTALQNRAHGFNDILKAGSPAAQTYMDALRRATGDATGLNVALMLTGENTEYVNKTLAKVSAAHVEAGNHVMHWSEIQETFNNRLHRAGAAMGALGIAVGQKLLPAVSTFVGWMAEGAQWLAKHETAATVLATALGILTIGLTAATVAQWAMNSAVLSNPYVWIAIAIVAAAALIVWAIVALVKHWDAIWGWIKESAIGVWHWLVKVWHSIADATSKAWREWIVEPIRDGWNAVKRWTSAAIDWIAAVPGRIGAFLSALPGILLHAAEEGAHRFFYAIGYGIGKVYVFFRDLPHNTAMFARKMWDGLCDLAEAGKDRVVKFVVDMYHGAVNTVSRWWSETTEAVANGYHATVEWCQKLPGRVVSFFVDMYHGAVERASRMANDVIAWVAGLPRRAHDAIVALPGQIWSAVSGAGNWLYQTGRDIVQGAINGIRSMFNSAMNTIKGWGHDLAKGFRDAVGVKSPSTVFAEVGGFLVAGLVLGITSNASKAVKAMTNLAGDMSIAPQVAIEVGTKAAGPGPRPGGLGSGWRPPVQPGPGAGGGGDRPIRIEVPVVLDGREVFRAIVPHAQQHKGRNTSTNLV